jgi:ribosomal protein L6P/L9E
MSISPEAPHHFNLDEHNALLTGILCAASAFIITYTVNEVLDVPKPAAVTIEGISSVAVGSAAAIRTDRRTNRSPSDTKSIS